MEETPSHNMISALQEQLDLASSKRGSLMEQLEVLRNKLNAQEERKENAVEELCTLDLNSKQNYNIEINTEKMMVNEVNDKEINENEKFTSSKLILSSSNSSSSYDGKDNKSRLHWNEIIQNLEKFKDLGSSSSNSSQISDCNRPPVPDYDETARSQKNEQMEMVKEENESFNIQFTKSLAQKIDNIFDEKSIKNVNTNNTNKTVFTLNDLLSHDLDPGTDLSGQTKKTPDKENKKSKESINSLSSSSRTVKSLRKINKKLNASYERVSIKSKSRGKKNKKELINHKDTEKKNVTKREMSKKNLVKSYKTKQGIISKISLEKSINMTNHNRGKNISSNKGIKKNSNVINFIQRNKELLKRKQFPKPVTNIAKKSMYSNIKSKINTINYSKLCKKSYTHSEIIGDSNTSQTKSQTANDDANENSIKTTDLVTELLSSQTGKKISKTESKLKTGAIVMKTYPVMNLYKYHPENLFLKNEIENKKILREKIVRKDQVKEKEMEERKYETFDKGAGGDFLRSNHRKLPSVVEQNSSRTQGKTGESKIKSSKSSAQIKANMQIEKQQIVKRNNPDQKRILNKLEQNQINKKTELSENNAKKPGVEGLKSRSGKDILSLHPSDILSEIEKQISMPTIHKRQTNKISEKPNDVIYFSEKNKIAERAHTAEPKSTYHLIENKSSTKTLDFPENNNFIINDVKNIFNSLPFIVGQSTSRSYNLRVNIQQTMSKLKMSPTTTVFKKMSGITNVTNKLSQHSTISTKHSYNYGPKTCPACVTKDIKMEIDEEDGLDQPRDPWDTEGINKRFVRCTCMPRNTVNFKTVMSQLLNETSLLRTPSLATTVQTENEDALAKEFPEHSHYQLIPLKPKRRKYVFSKVLHEIQRFQEGIAT